MISVCNAIGNVQCFSTGFNGIRIGTDNKAIRLQLPILTIDKMPTGILTFRFEISIERH